MTGPGAAADPPSPMVPRALTRATLQDGVRALTAREPVLAEIVARHGPPPLWARPQGFATLVRIILEQQVSLASAATLYARVARTIPGGITPGTVRAAGADGLRALGLTRQKAGYVAALADRVADGSLPLASLGRRSDAEVAALLMRSPGIGPWSSAIYLLMALRRPDVWPPGDLALHRAIARVYERPTPGSDEATALAERWSPWRAVAARVLWHGYLSERAG